MPVLSIIIPTHERSHYAVRTVKALLDALPESVQIVLSDTSVIDHITAEIGAAITDPRLLFIRPQRPMSVVEHFNYAVTYATGDYLCFIGDDDFVLPELAEIAEWAKRRGIDAVQTTISAHYYWPDFRHKTRGTYYSGTLHLTPFTSHVREKSGRLAMHRAARDLGTGVGEMPRAYAGLVAKELVNRIILKYGSLFGGVSPDIYSSALISQEARSLWEVDYPAIIPGSSKASTAGQSASGGHVGRLRENDHIGAFSDLRWNPLIPEFYSVPTVWAFSLLQAAEHLPELNEHAGYGRLYIKCLIWHRRYHPETIAAMKVFRNTYGYGRLIATLIGGTVRELLWISGKLAQRLEERVGLKKGKILADLNDSASALRAISNHTSRGFHSTLLKELKVL